MSICITVIVIGVKTKSSMEMWKAIVLSAVICICTKGVSADLTVAPRNTTAKVGDPAYLNCSTSLVSNRVVWNHKINQVVKDVWPDSSGSFYAPYRGRFELDRNSPGAYNLIVTSVNSNDAGTYICEDDEGFGQKRQAELIVLEDDPICASDTALNEIIGPNDCDIEPGEMKLTCNVTYNGNIPPKMVWKRSGDNATIAEGVNMTTDGKTVAYTHTFKADDISNNGLSFTCETLQATNLQYSCSTPETKILYAFNNSSLLNSTMDEEIVCSANSNQNCTYKWKWYKDQDLLQTVSSNKHLNPNETGKYNCEAECPLKNMSCSIVPMVILVVALASPSASPSTLPSSSSTSETPAWLWAVIVALVLLIVLAIVVIICFIRKRKLHKSKPHQNASSLEKDPTSELLLLPPSEAVNEIKEEKSDVKLEINSPNEQEALISQDANSKQKIEEDILEKDQSIGKLASWNIIQGKTIRGLAVGDGKIYVLTNDPNYLEMYGINDHKSEGMRSLDNTIEQPFEIAYCPSYKQIYVMDGTVKDKAKKIVVLNQFSVKITSWNTEFDFGNLSVASDCCIILAASRAIKEYLPDGKLMRLIQIHETILPLCVIKVDTKEFLVSHGKKDGNVHEVCLVKISKSSPADKTCHVEKVEKSFGRKTGSKSEQLNCPRSLALSENKDVFVLDEQNNRVLILNSDLKFKKELLLTEHGLQSPVKICLNESTQQLIIAGNSVESNHSTGKSPGILVLNL